MEKSTVLYSFKYTSELPDEANNNMHETDFVIVHKNLGYMVVEVKQGDIGYINGEWVKLVKNEYISLEKDPIEQAKTAMFEILRQYKKEERLKYFR